MQKTKRPYARFISISCIAWLRLALKSWMENIPSFTKLSILIDQKSITDKNYKDKLILGNFTPLQNLCWKRKKKKKNTISLIRFQLLSVMVWLIKFIVCLLEISINIYSGNNYTIMIYIKKKKFLILKKSPNICTF